MHFNGTISIIDILAHFQSVYDQKLCLHIVIFHWISPLFNMQHDF